MRWPGKIKAGSISNEIVQHHDWFPTFLAMAGEPDIVNKVKRGYKAIGRIYKNHIDGFNLVPYLTGKEKKGLAITSSTSAIMATCSVFATTTGRSCSWSSAATMAVWGDPFARLRMPKIFNLRTDPYEVASTTSNTYWDFFLHNAYFIYVAQTAAAKFADTPPVQKPNTFTVDDAIAKMSEAASGD